MLGRAPTGVRVASNDTAGVDEVKSLARISVDRYDGPKGPHRSWAVLATDTGWIVEGPDGEVAGPFGMPVDALRESGACAFVPGTAICISTGGALSPFEVIPALDGWLVDPFASEAELVDWLAHDQLAWVDDHIGWSFEELGFDRARVIVIDDLLCGVCTARIPGETDPIRLIVPCEGYPSLHPVFLDPWATVVPDNGYGSAWYGIGEVAPGIQATAFDVEDFPPSLSFKRIPAEHPAGLYEEMLSWMSAHIAMTPGAEQFDLEVDGSTVTAVFPEDGPYAEAEGWLGPTVLSARSLEGS